jgi:hypothetical protein
LWKAATPFQKVSPVERMLRLTPAVGTSGKVFRVTEIMAAKVEGPPPLRAQKRSPFVALLAVTISPAAVTTSKERAWSAAVRC